MLSGPAEVYIERHATAMTVLQTRRRASSRTCSPSDTFSGQVSAADHAGASFCTDGHVLPSEIVVQLHPRARPWRISGEGAGWCKYVGIGKFPVGGG